MVTININGDKINTASKNMPNLSPSTITNNDKNSDGHHKNINCDKTNTASKSMPDMRCLDAEPHNTSPNAKQKPNSRELLLDCSFIIRASTKIERAAPHIYDRVRQADGASVTDTLKIFISIKTTQM